MDWWSFWFDFLEALFNLVWVFLLLVFAFLPVVLSFIFDSEWWLLLFLVTIPLVYAFFNN